nr:hypothetical protein TQ38_02425 [Novosphingobium sp. P6W]
MVEPGSPTPEGDRISVRNQSDHTMLLTGAERPWQAIAVRVDPARGDWFLLQLRQADEDDAFIRSKALYMLLDVQPDGLFLTILPCGGFIAEAVERAGGSISRDPQSAASCTFPDKTTLTTQLQVLLQQPPRHDVQLLPDAP